jgi:hypothetical protein
VKFAKPLLIATSALALFISACSTPSDSALTPQFGTAYEDQADVTVTDAQRGYTYVAGTVYDNYNGGDGYTFIRRYNQDGSLAWERRSQHYYADSATARAVRLDAAGNVYLGYSGDDFDDGDTFGYLSKLSPAGKLLYKIEVNDGVRDVEVDAAGNAYLSGFDYGSPIDDDRFFLRKYDTQAQLVWERLLVQSEEGEVKNPDPIDAPDHIGLGSDGSLYVAGYRNVTKYSNAGKVIWKKSMPDAHVAALTASGQNVYLASNAHTTSGSYSVLLQKLSSSGSLVWQKTIAAAEGVFAQYLAVDASGNVYLAGGKTVGTDTDLFARKYTATGAVSWTYAPRLTGTYEVARGVSAKVSSNVYLAGDTTGKVNGQNLGGTDAFLMRLNAQGQKVWSR